MQKVKNTIPVYDICSLSNDRHLHGDVIAEPFAAYLEQHKDLHLAHRHTFYHVVLFTKGGGYHTIDFEQFPVTPGQIYFMIPGQVHSWSFEGDIDGYVINFSENLYKSFIDNDQYLERFRFFRGVAKESVICPSAQILQTVTDAAEKIVAEMQHKQSFSMDMVRAYLQVLLVSVSRENMESEHGGDTPPPNQLLLYNFRKAVDKYFTQKRLPKEYAAMLYITPNHLNALCNDLLGMPAGEVIRDRILLEVKRLLINADYSISEIAYQLNFTDNSHLTKFFKKHTHITPEEFRRSSMSKS